MPSSICKALNELPTTLDETYERALDWIPKEKRQHAHRLFQCLVVAIRPLRVDELAEVFAIEFEADAGPCLKEGWRPESPEDAVLSACSTLVAVIEDKGSKIVQFSHFSVKEYLTSDRLLTSEMRSIRQYYIPLDVAHTILARACLAVLLQLDENVDKKRLETFPLAFYAAHHWFDHAKYQDVASRIQDAMEQLFDPSRPYLASWTWIHDVDFIPPLRRKITNTVGERPSPPKSTALYSLYYAVICGFSGLVSYLIIAHAENVNAKCTSGRTPLIAASYFGLFDIAHLLLQHNADVNARSVDDWTPLHYSSLNGQARVAQLLLEHGATLNAQDEFRRTPLYRASENGHLEVVKTLLGHGATVNSQDDDRRIGPTPLYLASENGHFEVVKTLLEHGATVNAQEYDRRTPLCGASENGHLEVVKTLLGLGATVNAQDVHRRTPLYRASENGHLEVVKILLGHGADVHIRTGYQTPFQVATENGHDEVAQLLLEHGAEKE